VRTGVSYGDKVHMSEERYAPPSVADIGGPLAERRRVRSKARVGMGLLVPSRKEEDWGGPGGTEAV